MPPTITLYKCYRCDDETEWDPAFEAKPICWDCLGRWESGKSLTGWARRKRQKEIARLFTSEGEGVPELAIRFGIRTRTIYRALQAEGVNL